MVEYLQGVPGRLFAFPALVSHIDIKGRHCHTAEGNIAGCALACKATLKPGLCNH